MSSHIAGEFDTRGQNVSDGDSLAHAAESRSNGIQ